MVKGSRKLVWTERANHSYSCIVGRIRERSDRQAEHFKEAIQEQAEQLLDYPEMYQVESLYPDNPGTIRRFFCQSCRVVYEITSEAIVILNIYHVREDPSKIK